MSSQRPHYGAEPASKPASVAGIGAVTAYGWGEKRLRDGLYSGHSAVRPAPAPLRPGTPALWMASVDDAGDPDDGRTRSARAGRAAVREAVADAQDRGWRPGSRVGLVHAVSGGGPAFAMDVMQEFGLRGPAMGVGAMCCSGVAALLTATLWMDASLADDVVVVAADLSGAAETAHGPDDPVVLHTEGPSGVVCRPFQEDSLGANPGEAAVAMVLTRRTDASHAQILGGMLAQGRVDGHSEAPELPQLERAVTEALATSGVAPQEIAYLNAHGVGAAAADSAEAAMLDDLLTGATGLYSVKPLVGHCRVAAGLVELLATFYGFTTGVIPAPPRMSRGHPRLLDGPTAAVEGPVLKSSLSVGGQVAALVVEAPAA